MDNASINTTQERRQDYPKERRRMDDKILDNILRLIDRVSSMEATQETLVKSIEKYNNVTTRITSLEEYRCRCEELATRRRFPVMAVVGSVIGALIVALINKFVL